MSTERETVVMKNFENVALNTFSGGVNRGQCLQLTQKPADGMGETRAQFLQVSREDALELAAALMQFATGKME